MQTLWQVYAERLSQWGRLDGRLSQLSHFVRVYNWKWWLSHQVLAHEASAFSTQNMTQWKRWVRGKINAIWWNFKINVQKSANIRWYELSTNLQNFTQKNLTEVKIFQKVLEGAYFFETPCIPIAIADRSRPSSYNIQSLRSNTIVKIIAVLMKYDRCYRLRTRHIMNAVSLDNRQYRFYQRPEKWVTLIFFLKKNNWNELEGWSRLSVIAQFNITSY